MFTPERSPSPIEAQTPEERIAHLEAENEQLQQRLEVALYAASHDKLTGLANATGLEAYLETSDIKDKIILFIDGDNFGEINKKFSHEAGDRVIADMATILRTSVRDTDFIARQGGDEFVIITDNVPREESSEASQLSATEQATLMKDRIGLGVAEYLAVHTDLRNTVNFGVSVGAAIGHEGATFEQLRHEADIAMRLEKTERKQSTFSLLGSTALTHTAPNAYRLQNH